jgi:hypothetical protein
MAEYPKAHERSTHFMIQLYLDEMCLRDWDAWPGLFLLTVKIFQKPTIVTYDFSTLVLRQQ